MILQIVSLLPLLVPLNGFTILDSSPPKPWQAALMGRYIIHNSDWASVSTISTEKGIETYPYVSLESMSDGPIARGNGIPYLFITPLDSAGINVKKDNRCSILASLAQSDYCKKEYLDPEDPRCARVTLTGRFVKVDNTTNEYVFAKNALFSRHPVMKRWPTNHGWYIAKLNIEQVAVFDYFGGVKYVPVEDYLNANSTYDEMLFGDMNDFDYVS